MYPSRFTGIRIGHSLKPQRNRTKDFEKITWPIKNTVKVKLFFEKVKKLVVFKIANVTCNLVLQYPLGIYKFLKSSNHMLMTLQVPCNDYSKHYIMTGKRSKAFNVKSGKSNLWRGVPYIDSSPKGVPVVQIWWL